ncbi:hypothetical protein Hanom_Chr14g01325581 [Helianthus anomalus]
MNFFSHLKFELGELRFVVQKTEDMEERVIDFEALQKVLLGGIGYYFYNNIFEISSSRHCFL